MSVMDAKDLDASVKRLDEYSDPSVKSEERR